jgi:hypothetical protein
LLYKIIIPPWLSRFSLQRTEGGGEHRQDLGGERPRGRWETAVGEVLGERYGAERSSLTDVDPTGGQMTLEEDGQSLADQRVKRMHDYQRV